MNNQINTNSRKWWQFRKMSKKEYGRNFWIGILGGYILSTYGEILLIQIIGDVLAVFSIVCGIIWIILVIKERGHKKV